MVGLGFCCGVACFVIKLRKERKDGCMGEKDGVFAGKKVGNGKSKKSLILVLSIGGVVLIIGIVLMVVFVFGKDSEKDKFVKELNEYLILNNSDSTWGQDDEGYYLANDRYDELQDKFDSIAEKCMEKYDDFNDEDKGLWAMMKNDKNTDKECRWLGEVMVKQFEKGGIFYEQRPLRKPDKDSMAAAQTANAGLPPWRASGGCHKGAGSHSRRA